MKLRWVLLTILLGLFSFIVYGVLTAPSKLEKVEFIVVEKNGSWKGNISQYVLSYVHLGQDLTPDFLSSLRNTVDSLPWVEKCKLEVKGGKLTVKIWEAKPESVLIFDRESYLIGKGGFVLQKGVNYSKKYPIFFYKGETSPFTVVNGFLKLRKSVKMEMELLSSKVKEIELNGKKPEVSLLSSGVQLAFRNPPVLVFLGIGGSGWDRFRELSKKGFFKPGIYDFRFEQMVVIRGRQEECSVKRSSR